jgi:hypothetical protein
VKLKGNESLLILRCPDAGPKGVAIVPSLNDALPGWNGRDRASPVFEIESEHWTSGFSFTRRPASLIFLGPVSPVLAGGCLPKLKGRFDRAWLTLGLFNLVIYTTSRHSSAFVCGWADNQGIRWEAWDLKGTVVQDVRFGPRSADLPGEFLVTLAQFDLRSSHAELRDAREEYCALLATATSRAAKVDLSLVDELQRASAIITRAATDHAGRKGNGHDLPAIALLVDANAALSRFTSQMFSGFSPILETECHFWTHSLLGTGVANLALVKIRRFISRKLGEARIPGQIEMLRTVTNSAIMSEVLEDGAIWNAPWLHKLPDFCRRPVLQQPLDPLCPLVTYLSGRDGFHTTQVSLSAPLNILTSCSSLRWSLLTVTHEMSHRVVDEVLSFILPDPTKDEEVSRAAALINEKVQPANVLECLELKILVAMARLNAAAPVIEPQDDVTTGHILDLIGTRREEIEEVMVHVFDFIYFYGAEPDVYVPAIWRSWDAIPSLNRRLSAYVLRTLCAVYAKYWASPTATQDTIAAVTAGMEVVAKADRDNVYIQDALDYLKREKEALQAQLRRRRILVDFVRTFLQSPHILQEVRGQASKPDKSADLAFDGLPVENPLRFIETQTTPAGASALKSFLLLTRLAFDTAEVEPIRLEGVHK